MIGLKKQ